MAGRTPLQLALGGIAIAVVAYLGVKLFAPTPSPLEAARTIEGALAEAAAQLGPFPRRIDAATEMTGARAQGRTLTYSYRVSGGADITGQAERLPAMVCAEPSMAAAIRRFGVTYSYEYWTDATPPARIGAIAISACP